MRFASILTRAGIANVVSIADTAGARGFAGRIRPCLQNVLIVVPPQLARLHRICLAIPPTIRCKINVLCGA